MQGLDKYTIEFPCARCGFLNAIFFKQARLRDMVICRGCKSNIQLDDHMNECRKASQAFAKAIKQLNESLGNITLRLTGR
jgi:hypothetical protein